MAKILSIGILFAKQKELEQDIKDTEQTLRSIRTYSDIDWEKYINNDQRKPVKKLYEYLVAMRKELEELNATNVVMVNNEEIHCLRIGIGIQIDPLDEEFII